MSLPIPTPYNARQCRILSDPAADAQRPAKQRPGVRASASRWSWLGPSIEYEASDGERYFLNRNSALKYLKRQHVDPRGLSNRQIVKALEKVLTLQVGPPAPPPRPTVAPAPTPAHGQQPVGGANAPPPPGSEGDDGAAAERHPLISKDDLDAMADSHWPAAQHAAIAAHQNLPVVDGQLAWPVYAALLEDGSMYQSWPHQRITFRREAIAEQPCRHLEEFIGLLQAHYASRVEHNFWGLVLDDFKIQELGGDGAKAFMRYFEGLSDALIATACEGRVTMVHGADGFIPTARTPAAPAAGRLPVLDQAAHDTLADLGALIAWCYVVNDMGWYRPLLSSDLSACFLQSLAAFSAADIEASAFDDLSAARQQAIFSAFCLVYGDDELYDRLEADEAFADQGLRDELCRRYGTIVAAAFATARGLLCSSVVMHGYIPDDRLFRQRVQLFQRQYSGNPNAITSSLLLMKAAENRDYLASQLIADNGVQREEGWLKQWIAEASAPQLERFLTALTGIKGVHPRKSINLVAASVAEGDFSHEIPYHDKVVLRVPTVYDSRAAFIEALERML